MSAGARKLADSKPQFPCYLWHLEEETWIFASSEDAFVEGWEFSYSHWHPAQAEWPPRPTAEKPDSSP
jgi:hypothetical protein